MIQLIYIFRFNLKFLLFLPILLGTCCNSIDDSLSTHDIYFNPHENNNTLKDEFIYLFNLVPGDTVDFSGICSVSVTNMVPGDTTIVESSTDSVYARISSLPDTILQKNDSILGAPFFTVDDINDWLVLKYYTNYPDSFVFGKILSGYLPSEEFQSIATILSNDEELSDNQKNTVVEACNRIISTDDFYKQYRELIWAKFINNQALPLLEELVNNSVLLDTAGTVVPGLSLYKQSILRWFYTVILQEYIDRGVIIPTISAQPITFINRTIGAHKIYRMIFRQGVTSHPVNQHSIIRYVGMNSGELIQVAYIDDGGLTFCKDTKIADYPFSRGKDWQATPLIFPKTSLLPNVNIHSLLLPSRAVFLQNKTLSNDSLSVFDCKLYYPLNGTILENGTHVTITGKISIVYTFKIDLTNFVSRTAYITHWNTKTVIQKTYSDNNVTVCREKTCLVSPQESL